MIEQDPHALGVIATLEAAGLTVGDGVGKVDSGGELITPQVIVHMIPGGQIDGTAASPDAWADARFQLTAVGSIARQARWALDKASTALADNGVTVAGRVIQRVRPVENQPWGKTERDQDVTPPVFYATRVYGMHSFPE